MNCDCVQQINEKLAERNMELDVTLLLSNGGGVTLSMSTHWKDASKKARGQKPTTLIVNFCPFCGTSAEKVQAA